MEIIDLSNNLIECTICFYPVINDKYVTDCSHTFHHICLYEWCQQKNICPLCTSEIIIAPFNVEDANNGEMELRESGTTNSSLIDAIEYQRYLEYIERQRYSREQREMENARIGESGRGNGSTIVIINDYNAIVSDDEDSQYDNEVEITTRERIKMRIYIFLELTTTLALTLYILNVMQFTILLLCACSSITYKMRLNNMRFLSLFLKIIYIIYSVLLTHIIYYEQLIMLFPWIMISVVK